MERESDSQEVEACPTPSVFFLRPGPEPVWAALG